MNVQADQQASITAESWVPLAGIIATVSVFAIAQGLSYPLLSIILERQGHSPTAIGLSAAMMPVGLIASSAFIPSVVRRFGAGPVALTCAAVAALLLALIGWTQDIVAWFPLRFLFGCMIGPLYVLSEVWIISLAPPARRGRILGLYSSTISAGFALGPFSLLVFGTEGWPPFLVGIFAFVGCFFCLSLTLRRLPDLGAGGDAASVRGFVSLAPILLACVAVAAAVEQAVFSLLPVYGVDHGSSVRQMSAVIGALVCGSIALQVPLGMAAERWGPRPILVACAAAAGFGSFLLPTAIGTPLVWLWAVLWGAMAYGIYTLSLAELGQRFTGALLVAGNAAFALMWGVGGIAGPPAAGAMMDAIGPEGLPVTIGVMCLGLAAVRLARR